MAVNYPTSTHTAADSARNLRTLAGKYRSDVPQLIVREQVPIVVESALNVAVPEREIQSLGGKKAVEN